MHKISNAKDLSCSKDFAATQHDYLTALKKNLGAEVLNLSIKKYETDAERDYFFLMQDIQKHFFTNFKSPGNFDPFFFLPILGSLRILDINKFKQFKTNGMFDLSFFFKNSSFEQVIYNWGIDEFFFYKLLRQAGHAPHNIANAAVINLLHQYPGICFSDEGVYSNPPEGYTFKNSVKKIDPVYSSIYFRDNYTNTLL